MTHTWLQPRSSETPTSSSRATSVTSPSGSWTDTASRCSLRTISAPAVVGRSRGRGGCHRATGARYGEAAARCGRMARGYPVVVLAGAGRRQKRPSDGSKKRSDRVSSSATSCDSFVQDQADDWRPFHTKGLDPAARVEELVKRNGGADMPVWSDAFRRSVEGYEKAVTTRIQAIVEYLKSVQVKELGAAAGRDASVQEVGSLERRGDTGGHGPGGLLGGIPKEPGPSKLRALDEHHPPRVLPRAQNPRAPAAAESGQRGPERGFGGELLGVYRRDLALKDD